MNKNLTKYTLFTIFQLVLFVNAQDLILQNTFTVFAEIDIINIDFTSNHTELVKSINNDWTDSHEPFSQIEWNNIGINDKTFSSFFTFSFCLEPLLS